MEVCKVLGRDCKCVDLTYPMSESTIFWPGGEGVPTAPLHLYYKTITSPTEFLPFFVLLQILYEGLLTDSTISEGSNLRPFWILSSIGVPQVTPYRQNSSETD